MTVKDKDGAERRIECACKVWSAGVQASPLGKMLAEQSDGTETDRAGRVVVEPDLTVKGHPHVFVVGDLMSVPGVPGMAQGAIQGAKYATKQIKRDADGQGRPGQPRAVQVLRQGQHGDDLPVQRRRAGRQARVRRLHRLAGLAGAAPVYLVGFKNRFTTLITWFITFLGRSRGQMAITSQMIYARLAMDMLQNQQKQNLRQSPLAAVEEAEKLERERGVS